MLHFWRHTIWKANSKMKILLLATLVITLVDCAKQNSPFEEVHELLNYGEQLAVPENDLIVLMGSSGVDKGTLIKFVIQDESLKVRRRGNRLVFESGRSQNRTLFQDVLPHFYQDKATGNVLVDIPGFSESREPKLDIAGAYFTKRVLQQAKKLKIVFVENHANLMDGADTAGVLKLLRHATKQIPDIAHYKNSVGFVIAKVHDQDQEDSEILNNVLNQLMAVKEDLEMNLAEQDKYSIEYNETVGMLSVLDAIYANGTAENLALFRRPDQESSPWASKLMSDCQRELRVLFFGSLDYYPSDRVEFPYSILHRSRDYIMQHLIPKNNQLTSRYFAKILKEFQSCIESRMKMQRTISEKVEFISDASIHLFESVETGTIFDSLESLLSIKEKLSTVCSAWKNIDLSILQNLIKSTQLSYGLANADVSTYLAEVEENVIKKATEIEEVADFYRFLDNLNGELKSYEVQVLRKAAFVELTSANYKDFIFNLSKFNIKVANKDKVISIQPTRFMFQDLNSILNQNLNHTTRRSFNNFGQELLYEGKNLILSEIASELVKFQKLQNLFLFAPTKIFIDCNLTLTDTNISLAAPIIEVVGKNLYFEITGSDGKNASRRNNDTTKDGSPGEDGKSAGNTLMLTMEMKNAAQLTITSRGGNGGNGQNGEKGLAGVSSPSPHFSDFYPNFVNGIPNWESIRYHGYTVEHPDKNTIILVNKQGARPPTSGGHGGAGGQGGKAGHIFVLLENDEQGYPQTHVADGSPGQHGEGGKGGGGHHTCARNVYSGPCKTKECELTQMAKLFFTVDDVVKPCRCVLKNMEFCDKEADASDGISGFVKGDSSLSRQLVNWKDFIGKLNESALFGEKLARNEDEAVTSKFVEYSERTMKTVMQIFRGMNLNRSEANEPYVFTN